MSISKGFSEEKGEDTSITDSVIDNLSEWSRLVTELSSKEIDLYYLKEDIFKKEQDIIKKHMWPVTLALPRYKESYVITLVDKYSAMKESLGYYKRRFFMKQQHK